MQLHIFVYEHDPIPALDDKMTLVRIGSKEARGFSSKNDYLEAFKRGHSGTARLWSEIVREYSDYDAFVHLDGDNIYVGNVVTEILAKLRTHDFVGFRRPYFRHPAKLPIWMRALFFFRSDTVHTFAFGFRRSAIATKLEHLAERIRGVHPIGRLSWFLPALDFFDRVVHEAGPGKTLSFLGEGVRAGRFRGQPSQPYFENLVLSFSAVGSGYSYLFHGAQGVPEDYLHYAKSSFALFNLHFLGLELPEDLEPLQSADLEERLANLDRQTWRILEP